MTFEDDHNHFCIYCGSRLVPNQHFCSQCGKKVFHEEKVEKTVKKPSKYESKVKEVEEEYNSKQAKASELVGKLFDPSHMSYSKFSAAIKKSNQLFKNQLEITKRMIELNYAESEDVGIEIENKIKTLNEFVDKMEDLINELVIQMGSNKKDSNDVNNLFEDLDDLIDSVKDY